MLLLHRQSFEMILIKLRRHGLNTHANNLLGGSQPCGFFSFTPFCVLIGMLFLQNGTIYFHKV